MTLPVAAGPPLAELAALIDDTRRPVLFDGGVRASGLACWNFLAFDPDEVLELEASGSRQAFEAVDELLARRWPGACRAAADAELPPFTGGLAGWLGYDLGRQLERWPARARPDADLPDACLGAYEFVLAEHLPSGRRLIAGRGSRARAERFLAEVEALARHARRVPAVGAVGGRPIGSFDRAGYERAVGRVRERILEGDVYQVNLCQRWEVAYEGRLEGLQAALRERFPGAFGALLRTPRAAVVSSSPELFVRRRGAHVESRPIKGTRPRGRDAAQDERLRAELEASPKEIAELSMIVDLVRNDLGRSAVLGSVQVDPAFDTEAWPTVFHRVARVRCEVDAGAPAGPIIAAAFPPASVTGTPKISALALIEDLEPVRRHVYTGAIGWVGAEGDFDLSVAIRIATLVDGRLLLPFGSGITLASDPSAEYEETLHKAAALFAALSLPLPGSEGLT